MAKFYPAQRHSKDKSFYPAEATATFAIGKKPKPLQMLDVKIKDRSLDLALNTGIQITHVNPVFDKDGIARKFTLPFSVPLTGKNKSIRKHKNRLDAKDKSAAAPSSVRLASHLILEGDIRQTGLSRTNEEVSVAGEDLGIWAKLRKIKINEILDTLEIHLPTDTDPQWVFELTTSSFPVAYSIGTTAGIGSSVANNLGEVDAAGAEVVSELNALVPGIAEYLPGVQNIKLDGYLVKANPIDSFEGMTINFHLNPALYDYQGVKNHVQDVAETPVETHCFPTIKWRGLYGNLNFEFGDKGFYMANNTKNGIFFPNTTFVGERIRWENTVIPCIRVPYILNKIAQTLGDYIWAGEIWDDVDFQKLIVVSNLTLDNVTTDQYDDLEFYSLNSFNPVINFNQHVPSMSAADFIQKLCTGLSLQFGTAKGVLSFKKNITPMSVAPMVLSGFISNEYSVEPNIVDGWTLFAPKSPDEQLSIADQLQPIESGGLEAEVEGFYTMYSIEALIPIDLQLGKIPYTHRAGQSPAFQAGANKSTMELTLLFDHGQQETSNGSLYVFASHDGINYLDEQVGAYSLSPSGEFGLYEKWHKGVIEYLVADKLSTSGYLHLGLLNQINQFDQSRVLFYHPEGGQVLAAVRSVQYTATAKGIQPARLELLYK